MKRLLDAGRGSGAWAVGTPRLPRGTVWILAACTYFVTSGCASAPSLPPLAPVDAGRLARAAEGASALEGAYRLVFEWSLDEPSTRLRGRGVARVEGPYRARLDLFLSNGERAAAAALVEDELRTAEGGRADLPPAPFLWGALGVFRPGESSLLAGGSGSRTGMSELRYAPTGGGELRFRLENGRLEGIEAVRADRAVEELWLEQEQGARFPRQATYRHVREVRELRITLESVENVETFPSEIWDPGS